MQLTLQDIYFTAAAPQADLFSWHYEDGACWVVFYTPIDENGLGISRSTLIIY